jgi:glucose-1-phosphate adenylyltransferase
VKPIFTSPRFLPPTKVENCKVRISYHLYIVSFIIHYLVALLDISVFVQVLNSIISHGCFLTECSVEHSVIGIRSRLELGVQLKVNY